MSGSSMTFTYDDGTDASLVRPGVRRVFVNWTSDSATGSVTGISRKIVGELIRAVTIPSGTAAPSNNYAIAVTDESGVNVLGGCDANLAARSSASTQEVYFFETSHAGTPAAMAVFPTVCDQLTIAVTNAGNSKQGQIVLYYAPRQ
jgi:hypothetical protein